MPFTPAHSALVLPFIRINPSVVSATGLIIGSMAPDFEYFFKMSVSGVHGHTLPGVLYFDLPVSLFLALVFHLIVKKNLINNLPFFLQKRFRDLYRFDFVNYLKQNYLPFSVSACVGALSHIFWDSFTHSTGYFVNELPFYYGAYLPFNDVNYPLWYALQHISTFVGLFIVILYIVLMPQRDVEVVKPSLNYWLVVSLLMLIIIFIRFDFNPARADIGNLVVSLVSAMCISLIFVGIFPFRKKAHG